MGEPVDQHRRVSPGGSMNGARSTPRTSHGPDADLRPASFAVLMKWYAACRGSADGRQHAERVGGQQDDVLRRPAMPVGSALADVVKRVGATGVL